MKIALSILTLGLSIWALPALATPSHPTNSRGKSEASASRSARPLELDLRLDAKDKGASEHANAVQRMRYDRIQDGIDWKGGWKTRPAPVGTDSLVPEPSALMLFGVGVLVALQAIPRRSSQAGSTGESARATQHG